jgi:regulatory protein
VRSSSSAGIDVVDQALRFLGSRPHAAAELGQKLRRKGYKQAEIEAALTRLRELGYVDDASFARSLIGWRSGSRGRRAIAAELAARGVSRETAAQVLGETDPDSDHTAARAIAARLLRPPASPEQVARVAAKLRRRGFGEDAVSGALRDFAGFGSD